MASTFVYQFLYFLLTKHPYQSHFHTLMSHSLAAVKLLKPFLLIAFRTILCAGPPSWRMGLVSWMTLTVCSCGLLNKNMNFQYKIHLNVPMVIPTQHLRSRILRQITHSQTCNFIGTSGHQ